MTAEQVVDVIGVLHIRVRWLMRGIGLMDANLLYPHLRIEDVKRLYQNLPPDALETWIRIGMLLLSASVDQD